eukprot:522791-Pleurochrysis_carterae.AAC.2
MPPPSYDNTVLTSIHSIPTTAWTTRKGAKCPSLVDSIRASMDYRPALSLCMKHAATHITLPRTP